MEININDFKNLNHYYIFKNITSGTETLDYKNISVISIMEDGIKVQFRKQQCANGHVVVLVIFDDAKKITMKTIPTDGDIPSADLVLICKVIETENDRDSDFYTAQLKFNQYSIEKWAEYVKAYADKQIEINTLVKKVGG